MKHRLLVLLAISSTACGGRLSLGDLGGGVGAGGAQATAGGVQATAGGAQSTADGSQGTADGTQGAASDPRATTGGVSSIAGDAQAAGGDAQAAGGEGPGDSTGEGGPQIVIGNSSPDGAPVVGVSRGNASSVCFGGGTRLLTAAEAVLDDFEGPAPVPAWSSYNDAFDTQGEGPLYFTRVSGGADGSNFAGLYNPDVYNTIGLLYDVGIDPAAGIACADVGLFTGLSFWAKPGPGTEQLDVYFMIPSQNPVQHDSLGRSIGGDCPGPFKGCYSFPGVVIKPMSTGWTHYTVPFTDAASDTLKIVDHLIQKVAFDRDSGTKPGAKSFWLDDVRFY